ncbi:MAG: MFS transporter [Planctomycetota bacterium]|nr:MAG: MFS transporter [Planctomycetota bacterium]
MQEKSWRQTYWAVWVANLITAAGMMSFLPFFPSLLEEMGIRDRDQVALWAGILFGAAPLSATFSSPVWGALGDRFGRRLMVLRAMLAIAFFVGSMYFARSPWTLLVLRISQGMFSGFIPPSITLVSISAPPDRQGRVAGDLQTALAIGAMIGPLVGGAMAAAGRGRQVFLLVAVAAGFSALLVWLLAREGPVSGSRSTVENSPARILKGAVRDIGEVLRQPVMRGAILLIYALQFGLGSTNPLLELHVRHLLQGAPDTAPGWFQWAVLLPGIDRAQDSGAVALGTSLLFTGMALANLLCLPLWGRLGDRIGHRRGLRIVALGSALGLFVQSFASSYEWLLCGRVIMGASMAGAGPLAFGLAAAEIAADKRGGAFGVVFSARTLAVASGGALGGWLSAWLGISGLLLGTALLLILVLGLFQSREIGQNAGNGQTRPPS